ncbi:hypothetical protein GUJ93_ZPchr0008g11496 [Zizania palustris]|uniref:peptidylprolyl isomerase n=1 Tax=Zizania palustris TaxID=103762 RepID=A0A8J5V0N2_ZIZPA|nr:hypothetical protein GUJ93_ZPchr0008g11496 [Zizania palustris]
MNMHHFQILPAYLVLHMHVLLARYGVRKARTQPFDNIYLVMDRSSPETEKKDDGMKRKLSELGEPDEYFNALKVSVGSEWVASEGGHGSHPGFAKWTVQPSSPGLRRRSHEEETQRYRLLYSKVHFTGKMLDGTVFASTREDDVPLTFIIGQEDVMQGFSMAVSSMQEGEKAVFTIPPELAGTKSGCPAAIPGNIPPNQALWFDIELISLVAIPDIVIIDRRKLKKTNKHGISMGSDVKPLGLVDVLGISEAVPSDGEGKDHAPVRRKAASARQEEQQGPVCQGGRGLIYYIGGGMSQLRLKYETLRGDTESTRTAPVPREAATAISRDQGLDVITKPTRSWFPWTWASSSS